MTPNRCLLSEQRSLTTGADTLLGPEMRSTGEVMGIDSDFSKAYAKAALAAGQKLPTSGKVFVSMTDKYKEAIVPIAKELKVNPHSVVMLCRISLHNTSLMLDTSWMA